MKRLVALPLCGTALLQIFLARGGRRVHLSEHKDVSSCGWMLWGLETWGSKGLGSIGFRGLGV